MKFTFTVALLVLCVMVVTAYRLRKRKLFDADDFKTHVKKYPGTFDDKKMMEEENEEKEEKEEEEEEEKEEEEEEDCAWLMQSCNENSDCCSKNCVEEVCVAAD